jgi:hypothetical protein
MGPSGSKFAVLDPVIAYPEGLNGCDFQICFQYTALWQGMNDGGYVYRPSCPCGF